MPSRAQRKKKALSTDLQVVNDNRLVLKKHKLSVLRSNHDFLTAIRVGRILNALLFSQDLVLHNYNWKKSADRRRWTKVFQINIGYLHEALEVFASVETKYVSDDFYQKARQLINPKTADEKSKRKLLKIARNSSFHLDKDDKVTKGTISQMPGDDYYLMSSDDGLVGEFHFDLADEVDMYYVVENFRESASQSRREILLEIGKAVSGLQVEVVSAANEFLGGLMNKLDLKHHQSQARSRPKRRSS